MPACTVHIKATLAEAEKVQASRANGNTHRYSLTHYPHPASSSWTPVHQQRGTLCLELASTGSAHELYPGLKFSWCTSTGRA